MNIGTFSAIIFLLLNIAQIIYQWKEKNRMKAKEECWNKDVQSIVNIAAKMQERLVANPAPKMEYLGIKRKFKNIFKKTVHPIIFAGVCGLLVP